MLYEIKVYLSYAHYPMAAQSIDKLLEQYPGNLEVMLLKLELLMGCGQLDAAHKLAEQLRQGEYGALSVAQAEQLELELNKSSAQDKPDEPSESGEQDADTTLFDDDTQLYFGDLPDFSDVPAQPPADEANASSDDEIDDDIDKTLLLDAELDLPEDTTESLSEEALAEANNQTEQSLLNAIQQQMDAYVADSDEQALLDTKDRQDTLEDKD